MPVLTLPGFDMHYQVNGHGSETIVLVHGNIASTVWWSDFVSRACTSYRLVTMDLRGCGASSHPASGHTISQFAADIHALTQHLQLNRFHLAGHSMGGQISLYYTLQYPQQVHTLTLLDSVPADGLPLDHAVRTQFEQLMSNRQFLQDAVALCIPFCKDKQVLRRLTDDAFACSPLVYRDNPETMHQTVLLDRVAGISCPVLIVHGKEDAIIPLSLMQPTLSSFPKAQIEIFDNCGHSPQLECPDLFFETYTRFLSSHPL